MTRWNIDPDHSVGAFSISHMTVAFVHGQLNNVSGTIDYDPDSLSGLSVDLEIGVESIITGITKRDDHLKSSDFFDIAHYPAITYKSVKSEPSGVGKYKITGDLTIHGIEKKITLNASVSGPAKSPFGETSLGVTVETVLSREAFGIKWNQPLEGGGIMVGKEVEISVSLEADL